MLSTREIAADFLSVSLSSTLTSENCSQPRFLSLGHRSSNILFVIPSGWFNSSSFTDNTTSAQGSGKTRLLLSLLL
jgi:hypothetical protein